MGWTNRDIINQAFEEIGLAGYVFDLQPQQIESAVRRLDAMMATWNGKGLRLGYPVPNSPGSGDPDENTNVSDMAVEAMILNLAVRIAPIYGKTVSPDTKATAKGAYNQLMAQAARPIEMQRDAYSIPAGAGHKGWRDSRDPFLVQPTDELQAGPDSLLEFE